MIEGACICKHGILWFEWHSKKNIDNNEYIRYTQLLLLPITLSTTNSILLCWSWHMLLIITYQASCRRCVPTGKVSIEGACNIKHGILWFEWHSKKNIDNNEYIRYTQLLLLPITLSTTNSILLCWSWHMLLIITYQVSCFRCVPTGKVSIEGACRFKHVALWFERHWKKNIDKNEYIRYTQLLNNSKRHKNVIVLLTKSSTFDTSQFSISGLQELFDENNPYI